FAQLEDIICDRHRAHRYGRFRCNYDAVERKLSFSMPSGPHEKFVADLQALIGEKLSNLCTGNLSTRKAMIHLDLCYLNQTTLTLYHGDGALRSSFQPDIQIARESGPDDCYPQLVVEVAMSQSWPELRSKLVNYIVGSQGSIKFALGVKLYERSQRVRIIAFAPDCQGDEEIERLEEASDDGYA